MTKEQRKACERLAVALQTEAEFQAEISRLSRDNGKAIKAKNGQTLARYWSNRARRELFRLIGAEAEA